MPDAVILDLEDAVHPDAKPAAREAVARWHAATPAGGARRYLRINAAETPEFATDMAWLAALPSPQRCDGLVLPKAESPQQVAHLAQWLEHWQPQAALVAIIETARGLAAVEAIAAVPGVTRLAFGSLDFSLDIGCEETPEAFLHARSRIVVASRVAGLPAPVDGVTPDFADMDTVRADAIHARWLGFGAKLCIHPVQLAPVRDTFVPDAGKLAWAQRVLAAAERSHAVQVDGKMVDLPLIEQAQRVLRAAAA